MQGSRLIRNILPLTPLLPSVYFRQVSCTSPSTSSRTMHTNSKREPVSMQGKVVLITGASVGIGEAIARSFAAEKAKLILVGRRGDKLQSLKEDLLKTDASLRIHTVQMSVTDYDAVNALPSALPKEFSDVDVLVNNAGLALGVTSVDKNSMVDAKQVMDTNVLGTVAFCSAFTPGMLARGRGHIVNIGSVAGHYAYATGTVYNASKYAVRGFTEAARHDLAGSPIRVTHISPGLVGNTEFSNVRLGDDAKAAAVYANLEHLIPEDVADSVLYAVTRPAHCQVADVVLYCTNQSGPRDIVRAGPSMGAPAK